ncbi:hypothetical protein VOLCADRAFT_95921 [Volvox carteri f. nagariensis]|uniref:Activator of Hsp90 ATPase AHSA1-like N-terminal domain-containing protein n=1 Tax=Volvox carteri f. nagariensis TaxID=3068 RepID=D8U8Q4_VOLCA|nr:uncharacterized protein VOLCADRAFT_95921 [Volvox carteri f. nagariensis]EFJ43846.1 hypothetical protein VOLCADRAFT_95921 [Volvox carteri f. nagariensis]|eukprot:XP_002955092.1 hypothetical protein VOLCADRAFT_95921 [Volvox carteri f. nagariensis]
MLVRIASLLHSIVFAPWSILRPFLLLGRVPSSSARSAKSKARIQARKSSPAAQTPASSQPRPQQTKAQKPKMETLNGVNGAAHPASSEEKSKLEEQAKAKASTLISGPPPPPDRQVLPSTRGPSFRPNPPFTLQGDLSYSYWAGKGGGDVPLPEPRVIWRPSIGRLGKLTEEEKAEMERQASAAASGASAWNAAGTFEERGATCWAKSRLTELIRERELPGGGVTVVDVNGCEGEANIFIVRGKKRCGFDFELQLAWKAVPRPGAIEIRGHCKVLNFSSDDPEDLELHPEVAHRQPDRAADEAIALDQVRAVLRPELIKILTQLLEELKAK